MSQNGFPKNYPPGTAGHQCTGCRGFRFKVIALKRWEIGAVTRFIECRACGARYRTREFIEKQTRRPQRRVDK